MTGGIDRIEETSMHTPPLSRRVPRGRPAAAAGAAVALAAVTLCLALPALGQEPAAPPPGLEQGWYVVRPGDTLEAITARYLGSSDLWPANWALNPEVSNPHLLRPGQRLRVLLRPALPERAAQVTTISRRVEENPRPFAWEDASAEDLLLAGDGIRTGHGSSAELRFAEQDLLRITEGSLIYLRPEAPAPRPVPRRTIEIVQGQADLEIAPSAGALREVEVVLGNARATARGTGSEPAETRARRPQDGGAQVMVYAGESELEAAGAKVALGEGMGSSAPASGPPTPPERLLEAPAPSAPEAGARLSFANPTLRWRPVEGAVRYTVEVCADPACAGLVARQAGHEALAWTPERLPLGSHHWRVTGVSASGLDGYPSPPSALEILSDEPDSTPPAGRIVATGPHRVFEGRLVLGAGARLEVRIEDDASGAGEWTGILDGEEVSAAAWREGWEPGEHTVEALVADLAGNEARVGPMPVLVDLEAPRVKPAPTAAGTPPGPVTAKVWPEGPAAAQAGPPVEWSLGGAAWQGLARGWWIDGAASHLLLRPTAGAVRLGVEGGDVLELGPGGQLRLAITDDGVGVRRVRFGAEQAAEEGGWEVYVETEDLLGQSHTLRWPLLGP